MFLYISKRDAQAAGITLGSIEETSIVYFGRSIKPVKEMLDYGSEKYHYRPTTRSLRIFVNLANGDLKLVSQREARPSDSLIMKNGVYEALRSDIDEFLSSEKWYIDNSIPYHRGYLLYGPPGNGKTSLIEVIAGDLKRDICTFNLKDMTDNQLRDAMFGRDKSDLVVFEDVDCVLNGRRVEKDDSLVIEGKSISSKSSVTFSGLLNVLDGFAAKHGLIIFMTTNHIERLDPALIRPGRIDYKLFVDNADHSQVERMVKRFYGDKVTDGMVKIMTGKLNGSSLSMASLQGHLIKYRNEPELAVDKVHELTEKK